MIDFALRDHIYEKLPSLFADEISARELEVTYGTTEMPSMTSVRLANHSQIRSLQQALGFAPGVYKLEVDLMILIDVIGSGDALENEAKALDYSNRVLYEFVLDPSKENSLHKVGAPHSVVLDFLSIETDQINDVMLTTAVVSILWRGKVTP